MNDGGRWQPHDPLLLGKSPVIAFAATADPAKAKQFYRDVLGLPLTSDDQFALLFDANGTMLRIAKVQHLVPVQHTVLGWRVDDIVSTARRLGERGVNFERYPWLTQDELGIWTT